MHLLRILAIIIIVIFFIVIILLFVFQTKLVFYPGKLSRNYKFKLRPGDEEVFITTKDDEKINALFYHGDRDDVILYFHGNAGDLSGWQFVAEDFVSFGYSILIIDYRGYGKSTGTISEKGFYKDAEAAHNFLVTRKNVTSDNIIIYGRSIGTGVAVELARNKQCKGLVLESPYTSLKKLANEKLPFFFPSLYLKFSFNNLAKIQEVKSPVIFLHGSKDTLIPASHTQKLFKKFTGKKKMILIAEGSHNDLNSFEEHQIFLKEYLSSFFEK